MYFRQIGQIIDDVLKTKLDPPVGILTADDRDPWAVVNFSSIK